MDYIARMRALREDHDLTQQQVADALGTSQTMYARYERGANELPLRHLIALCRLYHVSADYILNLTETKQHRGAWIDNDPSAVMLFAFLFYFFPTERFQNRNVLFGCFP